MAEASWELFRAMLVRSWVVLVGLGAKMRHVGSKMATKSDKMSEDGGT